MSATTNPTRNPLAAPLGGDKQGEILLTPKEAASLLKVSESFLAKARMRGDGPRYRKLSRAVGPPGLVEGLRQDLDCRVVLADE